MENRRTNFGNKRANFGNKQVNQLQQQNIQPQTQIQSISQNNNLTSFSSHLGSTESQKNSSNIITIIILLILFIIIAYVIYVYGEKIYSYFNNNILVIFGTNGDYYLMESEEEKKDKIKCKMGCVKGKCEKNDNKDGCKDDDECNLCVDNNGGFYGTVPKKEDTKESEKLKAIEEENIIQNKRIKELEEMIKNRNKQIDDLNKYIDYLNKNKDKINKEKIKEIYEEEDKKFIIKTNYS